MKYDFFQVLIIIGVPVDALSVPCVGVRWLVKDHITVPLYALNEAILINKGHVLRMHFVQDLHVRANQRLQAHAIP